MGWASKVGKGVGGAVNRAKNSGSVKAISSGNWNQVAPEVAKDYSTLFSGTNLKDLQKKLGMKKKPYQTSAADLAAAQKKNWIDYMGATDKSGNLMDQYKLGGADSWLADQLRASDITRGQNIDLASKGALTAAGQQQANLAMTGGLSSGARERIAQSGARDFNLNRQGTNLQSDLNNIGLQSDAFEKNQAANQFNIQNQLADIQAKNSANQAKYAADMQAWAAQEQARATAKSGKK